MLGIFNKNKKEKNLSATKAAAKPSVIAAQPVKNSRKIQGVVVSNKMKKTVVVAVSHMKLHPKYKKYFPVTKRFKAHDENNQYQVGDTVVIQETKPLSKEKRWSVISKIR